MRDETRSGASSLALLGAASRAKRVTFGQRPFCIFFEQDLVSRSAKRDEDTRASSKAEDTRANFQYRAYPTLISALNQVALTALTSAIFFAKVTRCHDFRGKEEAMAKRTKRFAVFVEIPVELLRLIDQAQRITEGQSDAHAEDHSKLKLPVDLPSLLAKVEEQYVAAALQASGGNIRAAASSLGLNRTTLSERLRRGRARAETTGLRAPGEEE